ncbi:MAG: precorrin-4 C(11)-methyltransferase [Lachnospiraceae bacterium]|nr:precorrin-4 C(11)-methyltransferase [Lachnospiraceae bacterium]
MIHFVGAGPGAADLITLRGAELLRQADKVIYAGSLINKELLKKCKTKVKLFDSSEMTLDEIISEMEKSIEAGEEVVRLHSGDPSIYGAVREQLDRLSDINGEFDITPGVSSFTAAAAALNTEYTLPAVSQSIIITRVSGRTKVPGKERLKDLASHGTSMAIFLSYGLIRKVRNELLAGGVFTDETPAAIVYKVSHGDEKLIRCNIGSMYKEIVRNKISKTALILVGDFLNTESGFYEKSRLYDENFSTLYRKGSGEQPDPGEGTEESSGTEENRSNDIISAENHNVKVVDKRLSGVNIKSISFTESGKEVALRLKESLGKRIETTAFKEGMSLEKWTLNAFDTAEAVVFIGAAGIAVRSIAPFIESKDKDPAVIVIDDMGENIIPVLSGHLGGANKIAEELAKILGGRAVITTATDIHKVFAVDEWAASNGMTILNPEGIKNISSRLLRGEKIEILSYVNLKNNPPEGIKLAPRDKKRLKTDVIISGFITQYNSVVNIAPKSIVIGAGCRRGTTFEKLKEAFDDFIDKNGIIKESIAGVASIDIKENEISLHKVCKTFGVGLKCYSARELNAIKDFDGVFSTSDFVKGVTGTDNVCERAAIAASGAKQLRIPKSVYDSVTLAAAEIPLTFSWEY